jgi:hypothetical protein
MGHIAECGRIQFCESACWRIVASDGLFVCHAGLSMIDGTDTVNANAENLNASRYYLCASPRKR